MKDIFKEHFGINGGSFKTHEDEVEAYAKKIIVDFYKLYALSENNNFTTEQKEILADKAYNIYKIRKR